MIYTHGLDQSIDHVMVYDGNTPIEIIKLFFWYNEHAEFSSSLDDYDEQGWICKVGNILQRYSMQYNLPLENLSAKPVKILHALDLKL